MNAHCQLYRHFDADGKLLYVGISINSVARLVQHRSVAEWFPLIRTITVESFFDRKTAERAELDAILKEKPRFNQRGAAPEPGKIRRRAHPLQANPNFAFEQAMAMLQPDRLNKPRPAKHP